VRRDLERGLHPLVALLPRYLFGAALVGQAVVLTVPLDALHDVARALLGTAVMVGLAVLAFVVVDFTTAPVGSITHRLRGLAAAWTAVMTVGFTLAWYVAAHATPSAVFAIELVAFAGGFYGYREAVRLVPRLAEQDSDEDDDEVDEFLATRGWSAR
jgi:hypothetical protein